MGGLAGRCFDSGRRARPGGGRVLWIALIGILIAALTVVSVIDVDGDPATTNTPPVVLASGADLADAPVTQDETPSDPSGIPVRPRSRTRQALQATIRLFWHPRTRQIRGP